MLLLCLAVAMVYNPVNVRVAVCVVARLAGLVAAVGQLRLRKTVELAKVFETNVGACACVTVCMACGQSLIISKCLL
jgi:hypothetical protein